MTRPQPTLSWPLRILIAAVFTAVLFGVDMVVHRSLIDAAYNTLIRIAIFAILSASLNLVNGITGQFSLGHAAFMVIGAYTGGALTKLVDAWAQVHAPTSVALWDTAAFILGIGLAALAAALAGLLVGLPTLRLRGDYLAIATLGFGEITRVLFQACEPLGGATGLINVPKVTTLFWAGLVAAASILLLRNLLASGPGRDFLSVREDEVAAASVGVDVVRAKVAAFAIAAAFAGVAGTLLVHLDGVVDPTQAGFIHSIEIVVMVVLGGMGSLTGSVLGAAILVLYHAVLKGLPALNAYSQYESTIYPILLLGIMLVRREGLLGTREMGWNSFAPFFSRWRKMEKP